MGAPKGNKNAKGNDGGRPPLYDDPLILEAKIDLYFDQLGDDIPSVAALAFELGFSTRNALWEYEQKVEFSDSIKRAKLRIEIDRTSRLLSGPNTAGVIFDLTNNYGWKNPMHMKHSQDADGGPVETKELSDREYARRTAFLLRRAASGGPQADEGGDAGADEGAELVPESRSTD